MREAMAVTKAKPDSRAKGTVTKSDRTTNGDGSAPKRILNARATLSPRQIGMLIGRTGLSYNAVRRWARGEPVHSSTDVHLCRACKDLGITEVAP